MSSSVTSVRAGDVQRNDLVNNPLTNQVSQIGNGSWGDIRSNRPTECLRIGFWNCGGIPLKK